MVNWNTPHEHAQWLVNGTAGVEVEQCPAMDAARAYLEHHPLAWAIVLASEKRGSGKSFAAAWLLERLVEWSRADFDRSGSPEAERANIVGSAVYSAKRRASSNRAMWCDCAALLDLGSLKPWERDGHVAALKACWVLVLDDLGTERDADLVKGLLTGRQVNGLVTICTTNLTGFKNDKGVFFKEQPSPEWHRRYDARIGDRLKLAGDHERGGRRAWVYCQIEQSMRGRVQPKLHAPIATSSRTTQVALDLDALVQPLLDSATVLEAIRPATADEVNARELEHRRESKALRDAVKAKVRAAIALEVLEASAERGNATATGILREVDRRLDGTQAAS